jgi:hypothetical protein
MGVNVYGTALRSSVLSSDISRAGDMDGDDMYVDDIDGDDMDDACMRGTMDGACMRGTRGRDSVFFLDVSRAGAMDGACMRGTPGPNSIFFFFSGGAEVAGWSILLEVDA